MGLTKDLNDGNSVVLLYARNFEWKTPEHEEITKGAPFTGRVYRALKDGNNNVYYVNTDNAGKEPGGKINGVRLSQLTYNTPEWSCDFVELNDDNIIDFDISPEDYKNINYWVGVDHKDFLDHLKIDSGMDVVASTKDKITEAGPGLSETELSSIVGILKANLEPHYRSISTSIEYLSKTDPMVVEAVAETLKSLVEISRNEEKTSILIPLSKEIALSEKFGKGANMYGSILNLENYINSNNTDFLFESLYHIFLEISRNQIYNRHGK